MFRPIAQVSRALSHFRWLFMPLGLFALVAVGVHAGAAAAHDGLLVGLDWLDGQFDRAATVALLNIGGLFHVDPATSDRWVLRAVSLIDMPEREFIARWLAVLLELGAVVVLALPVLGYREKKAEELARATAKEQRLAELVAQKLADRHSGVRPVPSEGGLKVILRATLFDPTLLRLTFPLATAAVVLAGACRIAIEMQTISFGGLAHFFDAQLAGNIGRAIALFVLGAILVSLGFRSVLQSLWWAHRRAEEDHQAGRNAVRRRLRGWMRIAVAGPLAVAAAIYGAPILSFFR